MRAAAEKLHRLGSWLTGLLYPRGANCLCCGHPRLAAETDCLCPACREALKARRIPPGACPRCLNPVKHGQICAYCASPFMRDVEKVYAPYRFGGAVRELIHAFKFDACGEAAPLLMDAMADALPDRDFDCLVPVPLHKRRLRQRGFNQSLLLAEGLSARTGLPAREMLARLSYHRPQSRSDAKQRLKNVEGAFSALPEVMGQRVLLVDDVRTTGSTAAACAKALKARGAKSVSLCVCAVVYGKK